MSDWIDVPQNPPEDEPPVEEEAQETEEDTQPETADEVTPSTDEPSSGLRRFRWQLIVLGIGLLMIAVAGLFFAVEFLLNNVEAPIAQPDVPGDAAVSEGQIYREAIVGEPAFVNPLLASSQAERDLVSLVFSGLTRVDQYGEPVPDLAESWEISDDGRTYTFTLRDDATWHDGEPVTSDDVIFTVDLLRDPDFPGPPDLAAFWRTIEVYAEGERVVRFELTQPLSNFPEYAGIGLLPEHWFAAADADTLLDDPFNLDPIGSGPLDWVTIDEEGGETTVRLMPFTDYYDDDRRIQLEAVEFLFYEDAANAYQSLGRETLAFGGLSEGQLEAIFESDQFDVYTTRRPAYATVIFNYMDETDNPFFQDDDVREALARGIDRGSLLAEYDKQVILANSPILPGTWAYNPLLEPWSFAPDQAANQLTEAGWVLESGTRTFVDESAPTPEPTEEPAEGEEEEGDDETEGTEVAPQATELSFTLLVAEDPINEPLAEGIAQQWQSVLGIEVRVVVVDPTELVQRLQAHDFDAALVEYGQGGVADPDPYPFWHDSQIEDGQNYGGFFDRDISEAIEIARRDPNGVRRAELYREFQRLFIDEVAGIILYNPLYHYTVSCQVERVQVHILAEPSDRFRNMHEWRITEPGEGCP